MPRRRFRRGTAGVTDDGSRLTRYSRPDTTPSGSISAPPSTAANSATRARAGESSTRERAALETIDGNGSPTRCTSSTSLSTTSSLRGPSARTAWPRAPAAAVRWFTVDFDDVIVVRRVSIAASSSIAAIRSAASVRSTAHFDDIARTSSVNSASVATPLTQAPSSKVRPLAPLALSNSPSGGKIRLVEVASRVNSAATHTQDSPQRGPDRNPNMAAFEQGVSPTNCTCSFSSSSECHHHAHSE